tara:strand:+ start:6337 stop:9858 length:3522 start_codon:yes stop_codon:yes gene_type:complete
MARKFWLINRTLAMDPSLENRKNNWWSNEKRQHPMVSRRGSPESDYLRRSFARYFSWQEGNDPDDYNNFGYLNSSPLDAQAGMPPTVGANITQYADPYPVFPPQIPVVVALATENLPSTGAGLAKYIFGHPSLGNLSGEYNAIILSGAADAWLEASEWAFGTSGNSWARDLFNAPFWTNWQAYVLGGSAVTSDDDDTPERQFYGLFGDSGGTLYYDYQFEKDVPTREEVAVATNYNYYNAFFDEMADNSSISELYIPNLYVVYSIGSNGSYLYPSLYNDDGSSRQKTGLILSNGIGELANDYLDNSRVPIGQVFAKNQAPDSILNRFTRKDFSSPLYTASLEAQVADKNRHLGIGTELLAGPNNLLQEIAGRQHAFPYNAQVSFPLAGTGDLFDNLSSQLSSSAPEQALKFFLFEVMKANILDFNSGSYDFYESLDVSAREEDDGEFKYYGFDWTNDGDWVPPNNPEAREKYATNTIDVVRLFTSIFEELGNTYANPLGAGETYNGFINQLYSSVRSIVNGQGFIVGQQSFGWPGNPENDDDYNIFTGEVPQFLLYLGQTLVDHSRTHSQLLEGNEAYNQTLVYKLDKHLVDPASGEPLPEPVQSVYFPNMSAQNVTYYDTQVKFGQQYMYKAYSYDLVVGNQYKYLDPQVYPPPAAPWPTQLAPLMGFALPLSNPIIPGPQFDLNRTLQPDTAAASFAPFPGQQIYVGNPVTWTTTVPNPNGETIFKRVDLTSMSLWYNSDYSLYFDYWAPPALDPIAIEIPNVAYPTTMGDTIKDMNLTLLAATIEQGLNYGGPPEAPQGNMWRVRFIPEQGSSTQGRFVIAAANELTDLPPAKKATLAQTLNVSSGDVNALFDIDPNWTFMSPSPTNLLFRTGPHGYQPEYPWDITDAGKASAQVQNYRSVKIMELPYFETNVFEVVDLPPQFPDVEIVPLKGESKRIKILLNENATRNAYLPMIIEPEDTAKFEEIRIGQGRDPGEALVFGSDDSIVSFQIYRTDTPPQAYTDFAGHLTDTLDTFTPSGRSITTASKLDMVEPNVVYYYCFRTIDKNGFISVPSPILKVQMVDDNGRVYPIIEPYDLPVGESRSAEKPFKRYLEIDTSLQAKQLTGIPANATSAGNPLDAPSGVSLSGSVWDENITFKVRVVSKDTGRKLDLNLNFNAQAIPNPNLQGD